jgi:hypothetical protein
VSVITALFVWASNVPPEAVKLLVKLIAAGAVKEPEVREKLPTLKVV